LSTRRPLTTTAIAAGVGTVAALALGPMAAAATTQVGQRDAHTVAASSVSSVSSVSLSSSRSHSTLALADTGVDAEPYALGGMTFLVAGVGMIFVSRRFVR
jgi:hypothetical protein